MLIYYRIYKIIIKYSFLIINIIKLKKMSNNNCKTFKPEADIKLINNFRFNSLNNNQKNTHIQNQYYYYPNNTMDFNNMNRPSPNTNSIANNNLINNRNSNTTNIMDKSIKYMDFFYLILMKILKI